MSTQGSKAAKGELRQAKQTGVLTEATRPRLLPMYRVILHNDDVNSFEHVVQSIVLLTPLRGQEAVERTLEAHTAGCSLLLVTHLERAELYEEQFASRSLTVTIEPDE